jgi:hypothetical protein
MATLVQVGDSGTTPISSGTSTPVFPSNTTPGTNEAVAAIFYIGSATVGDIASVSGCGVGTWVKGGATGIGTSYDMEVWWGIGVTSADLNMTVTTNDGSTWSAWVYELADISSIIFNSTVGLSASPSLVFSSSANDFVGSMSINETFIGISASPPMPPWAEGPNPETGFGFETVHYDSTPSGTVTSTWTLSSSSNWTVSGFIATPVAPSNAGVPPDLLLAL